MKKISLLFLLLVILILSSCKKDDLYDYTINPDGVTCTIDSYNGHENTIDIPQYIDYLKVVEISNYALEDNQDVKVISVASTVETIGVAAFRGCSNLKEIYIPSSVVKMGPYVFEKSSNAKIYVEHESKPKGWDTSWNSDQNFVLFDYN